MQAQFFGRSERPLFGVRHGAQGAARDTAVLICPSWGLEALRSQRGLRQLAQALAAQGYEVLRFDYSGTGDSHGDGRQARLEYWLQDLDTAARELRDSSGRDRLCIVGMRIGGYRRRGPAQKRHARRCTGGVRRPLARAGVYR